MLVGRRYRLALSPEQAAYAERVGDMCRAVWNLALEQRRADEQVATGLGRTYRRRITYTVQCAELVGLKQSESWLTEAPSHCLLQVLRDLDNACRHHGPKWVHWRSKRRWGPSFRFPDPKQIGNVRRLSKHVGEVRLPKFGAVRFRWSQDLGGEVRNVTILRDGQHWYVTFCVENGKPEPAPNGLPAVGVDRGVVVAIATSDGELFNRNSCSPGEALRYRRLQKKLSRQKKGSNRRRQTIHAIGSLAHRVAMRRHDFAHQAAHQLTTTHGLVAIEDLRVVNMTRTAKGTKEEPGRNVRQKAGLNRAILDKGWGGLRLALEWHGRKNGCSIVAVPPAHTSQTCSTCGYRAAESRESQARFCCRACGVVEHADVNAARNILAAGLAVTACGDLGIARSMKRELPEWEAAHAAD